MMVTTMMMMIGSVFEPVCVSWGYVSAQIETASMAEWLRAWDTLAMMKLWRREVVSSIPDRGNIVG